MFNDALLEGRAESRRPWTIAVSFLAQCLTVALAILASLFTAGDLPSQRWVAHLLAPPPPPAARPAELVRAEPRPQPTQRFDESTLMSPAVIPEEVAVIADAAAEAPLSGPTVNGAVPVAGAVPGPLSNLLAQLTAIHEAPPKPAAPKPEPRWPREPVLVSSDLQSARLIHRVEPVYPALARQARVSGVVQLEAIIGEDGTIRQLRVLSGHPLLAPSARDAVAQWRYRPTLLGGVAVPVLTRIDVRFKLGR